MPRPSKAPDRPGRRRRAPTAPLPAPPRRACRPPAPRDVLYLVDLSGYVFRAYHALPPLSSSRGEPTHAVLGTVNMLQKVVAERRPHSSPWRWTRGARRSGTRLDARYKATRPAPPPDLSQQMARVEQIVHAWDVGVFPKDGFEADDLIAAVTARALAEGWRVVIVSADKDLMQLVRDDDDRVVLWDSMRDRVYGPREVREKLGVAAEPGARLPRADGRHERQRPGRPGRRPEDGGRSARPVRLARGHLRERRAGDQAEAPREPQEHEADARISQKLVTLDASSPIEWDRSKLLWGGANVPELRRLYTELEFTAARSARRPRHARSGAPRTRRDGIGRAERDAASLAGGRERRAPRARSS